MEIPRSHALMPGQMSPNRFCPECGAALAADSPESLSIEDIAVRVIEFCSYPSVFQKLDS